MFCPHFEVKVSIYFRVQDSELYGGPGSVGFVQQAMYMLPSGTTNLDGLTDKFADKFRVELAEFMGVPPDKVQFIPREEYERETEEDDGDGEL